MSKKSVIAAIALISIGIIFGIVLVSGFNGIKWSFAGDTKIGADKLPMGNEALKSISDGYIAIAKEINPKVVSIVVTTKPEKNSGRMNELFKFFGEEFEMPQERQSQGSGSGVIISADGYILTNNHVVSDADKSGITVTTYDKKTFTAKIIGTDKNTDLAVIKVEASDLPVAYLGNSDNVQVGQIVIAAGNPMGLNSTITSGIVSALGRNIGILNDSRAGNQNFSIENFIQTDAAINPGNSGGPLVDVNGAVIGINSAIATRTGYYQGYAFAIPINLAKKVADDIIKYGKVKRALLGITMDARKPIDETWAKALGLPKPTGVMVQEVSAGSAADEAGIKSGDVILEVDGKEITSISEVQDNIGRRHPGDIVKVKIFREGKTFEKDVKLKEFTGEESTIAENSKSNGDSDNDNSKTSVNFANLGFNARNMTKDEKTKLKVTDGVLVENVKNYGYAESRTLAKNDVITDVLRKGKTTKINNVAELEKVLKDCKPGEAIMLKTKSNNISRLVAMEIPKE